VIKKQALAQEIQAASLLSGEFKLRSGQVSQKYFDKYRFESQPLLLEKITKHLHELIPSSTDFLAGLELGGVPIATALSLKSNIPSLFVRKKAKDYGTCKLAEGASDLKNKNLCLVEDVITTGGQVAESCQALRDLGANVEHVLCVIYRGDFDHPDEETKLKALGLKVKALFTLEDFNF